MQSENEKAAEKWERDHKCLDCDMAHVKTAFLAGWNERDKQPVVLTAAQTVSICAAVVNCPFTQTVDVTRQHIEAILNGK